MATIKQQENYAFAESVRRQALRIATLIMAGKHDAAGEAALTLCTAGQREKRRITGTPEPEHVSDEEDEEAGYDLTAFNQEYGGGPDGPEGSREV